MKFCGNTHPRSSIEMPQTSFHESPEDARRHYREWLRDKVVAEPSACEAGGAEYMKSQGFYGVFAPETGDNVKLPCVVAENGREKMPNPVQYSGHGFTLDDVLLSVPGTW